MENNFWLNMAHGWYSLAMIGADLKESDQVAECLRRFDESLVEAFK